MNPFEQTLMLLSAEAEELQKKEMDLQTKARLFNEKLMGFLKEHGLPENFTMPQLVLHGIRMSRK